ncbi:hypothetical protein KKH59_01860 [Patescibacteria group bacterium]|nr:hypothetical protein [Patescibacteria group bacterium]
MTIPSPHYVTPRATSSYQIIDEGANKIIEWQVDWKAGEEYELKYQFDAPDVSPYLYLLGPLKFSVNQRNNQREGSEATDPLLQSEVFREIRAWQIAADLLVIITNSPSTTTGGWTNPTGAYADGSASTSIVSAKPSATQTYSGYGFDIPFGSQISQVRVRLDAWTGGNEYIELQVSADGGTT